MTLLGRGIVWTAFLLSYLAGLVQGATAYLTGHVDDDAYEQGMRRAHRLLSPSDELVD